MSVEQRSTIKLFVLNRKSNMETMDMLIKVYGYKAIKKIGGTHGFKTDRNELRRPPQRLPKIGNVTSRQGNQWSA
jgi:hypothetical protein